MSGKRITTQGSPGDDDATSTFCCRMPSAGLMDGLSLSPPFSLSHTPLLSSLGSLGVDLLQTLSAAGPGLSGVSQWCSWRRHRIRNLGKCLRAEVWEDVGGVWMKFLPSFFFLLVAGLVLGVENGGQRHTSRTDCTVPMKLRPGCTLIASRLTGLSSCTLKVCKVASRWSQGRCRRVA